ncbi:MAG: SDR family oxidoreductase [Pseudomonadota bacterium]
MSGPDFASLQGQTAVVTGASRGIGEAAARFLSECGMAVVLAARTADAVERIAGEVRAAGGQAHAVPCDVARYADVAALVEAAVARTGRLDLMVNNAGVIAPIARLAESDPDAWGQVIDINLKGVYHGMRAAIPAMLRQGGGVVVNISSGAAVNTLEAWSHYCTSKAGALMLTRMGHKEYGEQGIRVVGLSPGTVATEMQREIKASGVNPVSRLEWSDHIPPDWSARAIAWLATPAAAAHAGTDVSLRQEEVRRLVGIRG